MLLLMAVFTLASMLFIWLPFGLNSLVALYIFVFLYGFGTGSFVSLSMGCVGQLCRGNDFARWIGAMDSVVSIAYGLFHPLNWTYFMEFEFANTSLAGRLFQFQ